MKLALLALAAAAIAAPAFAQDQAPPNVSPAVREAAMKVREQCAADMQSLCASATDRPGRMQCMMQNQDKLSDGCKSAIQAVMAARQAGAGGGQH